jgi:hypothetical protein
LEQHLIAEDPSPEASRLDRLDGVGLPEQQRLGHLQQETEATPEEPGRIAVAYPE